MVSVRPDRAISVELPLRADGLLRVSDARSGASVEIALAGAHGVEAEIVRGLAMYRGATADGADVAMHVSDHGVEDFLFYAARPERERMRYDVRLGETVAGLRHVDGVLELLDAGGAPRIRVRAPWVAGNDGARRPAELFVEGCAVDSNPAPPWGRPVVPLSARRCVVGVDWSGASVAYPAVVDPGWVTTQSLSNERYGHTATRLDDGRVLAVSGSSGPPYTDIFDPSTSTWAVGAPLPADPSRYDHTASKLADGTVLVAGGDDQAVTAYVSACLYDPTSGTWSTVGDLARPRSGHTATVVGGDQVFVCGGASGTAVPLTGCERYQAGVFTPAGNLVIDRWDHTATLLANGKILLAGGGGGQWNEAELYDPVSETSVATASMASARANHAAALLPDGSVLVAGGHTYATTAPSLTQAERYDPATAAWTPAGTMNGARALFAATPFANGILVVGGAGATDADGYWTAPTAGVELYDPAANTWSVGPSLAVARDDYGMAALADGSLLVTGGFTDIASLSSVERLTPAAQGTACKTAAECASGSCVGGVCCDVACTGPCQACTQADKGSGADGTCGPVATGTDPKGACKDSGAAVCAENGVCDGAGACAKYATSSGCTPMPCSSGVDCASGFCADGICCDKACDGKCETCLKAKGATADGACSPVPAGTDPDDDCPDTGSGDCTSSEVCAKDGSCQSAATVCAPFACIGGGAGCASSCTSDADCALGYACMSGTCVKKAATCEDHIAVSPDGKQVDCTPYKCVSDGSCRTSCASIDDCAAPNVCNTQGKCEASAPGGTTDSGCGCHIGADDSSRRAAGSLAAWTLVAMIAGARRRNDRRRKGTA